MLLTEADLALFARVSGDRNPLHCSPDHARGTPFGRTVAHGVLAALATWNEHPPTAAGVGEIDLEFGDPVHPGVTYRAERVAGSGERHRLMDGERVCLSTRVRPAAVRDVAVEEIVVSPIADANTAADLPAGTAVTGDYGPVEPSALTARFPAAARALGTLPLACLMWSSYLAGMRLPGRNCLLTRVALRVRPVVAERPLRLSYRAEVEHLDPRFGLLSLTGTLVADGEVVAEVEVEAMVRAPVPAPSPQRIAARLPNSAELRGHTAVVVGGSRGLGAAIVLALAGQGATVHVGHRGPSSALDALLAAGAEVPGRLVPAPGDAADPAWSDDLRARLEHERTGLHHLVCSAAPPIRALEFRPDALGRFDEFVSNAVRLVSAPLAGLLAPLASSRGRCLVISSSALHDPPADWPHYVAAKSAVEGLTTWAARQHPDVGFLLARPGMLLTEQMNSPGTRESADPVEPVAAGLVHRLLAPPLGEGFPLVVTDRAGRVGPPAGRRELPAV